MGLYETKQVDFQYDDQKGSLIQLIHDGFSQVNVLKSNRNTERGNHFHRRAVEAFYVIDGSVNVTLWDKKIKEDVTFKKGDFFEIHPYIIHSMYFQEDCLMVQMYSIPVENEDGTKDIFREEEFDA